MQFVPFEAKKVMEEMYEQRLTKPKKGVELPCTMHHKWKEPAFVELTRTGDQKVTCPLCGRTHYLVWSKIGNQKYV